MSTLRDHYPTLLRWARAASRRDDEAEDLLQIVLEAAVTAGRADMSVAANRAWVRGALRKRASFEARTALRRQRREMSSSPPDSTPSSHNPTAFTEALPSGLRTTARLVLSGHTKAELRWLLGVSDAALRQRFSQIRKRWRALETQPLVGLPGLTGSLPYGYLRTTLLQRVRRRGVTLASHDPDGHLFVVGSQTVGPRQPWRARTPTEE